MKKDTKNQGNEYQQLMKAAAKHYNNEEFEEALDLYLQASDLKPDSVEVLNKLGEVFCCLEDFDSALENFKKIAELNPEDADAYFNIGVVYDQKEDFQMAIEAFKKAAVLDPTDVDAFYNIGAGYDFLDKPEEAEKYYKKALEIQPNMEEASRNIAVIHIQRATDAMQEKNFDFDSVLNEYREGYKYMRDKSEFFEIMEHSVKPILQNEPAMLEAYNSIIKKMRNPHE